MLVDLVIGVTYLSFMTLLMLCVWTALSWANNRYGQWRNKAALRAANRVFKRRGQTKGGYTRRRWRDR